MDSIEGYYNRHAGRVFLLGNGPSLSGYDFTGLDPNETITMNRSWRECPRALYHCLSGDLRVNISPLPKHILFLGQPEQYSNYKTGCPVILVQTKIMGVHIPKPPNKWGVSQEFDLRYGWQPSHCGLFAVYAAWFVGFREIYLLGYDGYGGHYTEEDANIIPDHSKIIPDFVSRTNRLLKYDSSLRIFNCNPENHYKNLPIKVFDTKSIE